MLGAGMVSRPIARYLLDREDCRLVVASLYAADAEAVVDGHPSGRACSIDVTRRDQLEPLIDEADLVISLIPYDFHARVARLAIAAKTDMVTTSYVSPEMRELDAPAKEAGILILNECGLDPGLDHMSAMRIIDAIHDRGNTVVEFDSSCGGLPSPEASNNPWRYKVSWSPRGALLASRQSARYLARGRVHHIPAGSLFSHFEERQVPGLGPFEVYPNRDSLKYVRRYGIDQVRHMFRGTYRYPGWCRAMQAVVRLGLLGVERHRWDEGTTLSGYLATLIPGEGSDLRRRTAEHLGLDPEDDILERLDWLGLFSDEPLPDADCSALDMMAARFAARLGYGDEERDMVLLSHRIVERAGDGRETDHRAELVAYGIPGGDTATSRTVSLPAAAAARMILERKLPLTGVHTPVLPQIYQPILEELATCGIAFAESSESRD